MRILGIDPGLTTCGWGVITYDTSFSCVDYGALRQPHKDAGTLKRLLLLHRHIKKLIYEFRPECVAVEKVFFAANRKTVASVLQARGVILLAAAQDGIPVIELTPLEVKRILTNFGAAPKRQVQRAVRMIFRLQHDPEPPDAADALAIAFVAALQGKRFIPEPKTGRRKPSFKTDS